MRLGLVEVAVQRDGRDAGVVELLGEHLGVRAGAGEDEGLALAVDELVEDLGLVAVLDHEHAVLDRAGGLVFTGDLVHGRLDEELVDQRRDLAVERRREQQLLRAVGGLAEDALHRLEESELAHVVGLVDHGDHDLAEVELALGDEVFDATGGADDDVDALLERTDLARLRHAAVDLRGEQADAAGDRLDGPVDLQRELARRREDERLRLAAELAALAGLGAQHVLDERRAEGDGLARAGAAAGEHVATREDLGDRRGLDRERRRRAEVGERADDVVAQAEGAEAHAVDIRRLDRLGLQALVHDVDVLLVRRGAGGRGVPVGAAGRGASRVRGGRRCSALGTVVVRAGRTVVAVLATGGTLVVRARGRSLLVPRAGRSSYERGARSRS